MWLKHAPQQPCHQVRREEKEGGRGGGQAREVRTGGDEVTPGELITGKWNKNKK